MINKVLRGDKVLHELDEELHKPIIENYQKRKTHYLL